MNNLEHIYVINLDKDTKKLQDFKQQIGDSFSYTRIKGVEPLEGNDNLNKGQLGCLSSHILILEDAIKNNYKRILIFEDDIILKDSWGTIKNAVNNLQKLEPNLVYLGCSQHKWYRIKTLADKQENIIIKKNYYHYNQDKWNRINTLENGIKYITINNNYFYCSQNKLRRIKTFACNKKDIIIENNYYHCIRSYGSFAVIINKSIYETLLNMYKQKCKPVDNYLIDYQLNNKEKCIVMYPNKVIADVTTSNTGNPRDQNKMAKQFRWI
jgi:GR25 family glycosyltransferase involved in LPS biosynthesis